jgi:hypothetical protein
MAPVAEGFAQRRRGSRDAMSSHRNQQSAERQDQELDEKRRRRDSESKAPEDYPDEPGAEGGADSPTRGKLPGMPAKDDPSPVGDTDQHSSG